MILLLLLQFVFLVLLCILVVTASLISSYSLLVILSPLSSPRLSVRMFWWLWSLLICTMKFFFFFSTSIMADSFVGSSSLSWHSWSFRTWNILLQYLLAFKGFNWEINCYLDGFSFVLNCGFSVAAFDAFLAFSVSSIIWSEELFFLYFLFGVLCASYIYMGLSSLN